MDKLKDEITAYAKSLGVDLFGVADLTPAKDLILSQGGQHVARLYKGNPPGKDY